MKLAIRKVEFSIGEGNAQVGGGWEFKSDFEKDPVALRDFDDSKSLNRGRIHATLINQEIYRLFQAIKTVDRYLSL